MPLPTECPPPPCCLKESSGIILVLNEMLLQMMYTKFIIFVILRNCLGPNMCCEKLGFWRRRKMSRWNPTVLIIMQSNHSVKLIKEWSILCLSESNGKKWNLMTFIRKWWGCSNQVVQSLESTCGWRSGPLAQHRNHLRSRASPLKVGMFLGSGVHHALSMCEAPASIPSTGWKGGRKRGSKSGKEGQRGGKERGGRESI